MYKNALLQFVIATIKCKKQKIIPLKSCINVIILWKEETYLSLHCISQAEIDRAYFYMTLQPACITKS